MTEPTVETGAPAAPELPPGRTWSSRGAAPPSSAEVAGPPGAPTVLLLHGWTATADLNWFTSLRAARPPVPRARPRPSRPRARHPHVGGRSAYGTAPTTASRSADELGIERVIPVGYSMGGPIAQLMWRRHRDRVDGLVLCATANRFSTTRDERLTFAAMAALAARPA